MKYIDALSYPHPAIAQTEGQDPRPLHAVLQEAVASVNQQAPSVYANPAVDVIVATLGRTLRYVSQEYPLHPAARTALESTRLNQTTSCLGYTMVGSEVLSSFEDTVGPHYIWYANGHAATVIPSEHTQGKRLIFCDFLMPQYNSDITSTLDRPVSLIAEHVADPAHPRGVTCMDTRPLIQEAREAANWTSLHNSATEHQRTQIDETRKYTIIGSIYTPELGRHVLHCFSNFRHAVFMNQPEAAAGHLYQMRGLYPDIDARRPHREIKSLISQLALLGRVDTATASIHNYTSSFYRSRDPRLGALEAELYAITAKAVDDPELARRAVSGYEEAASRSKHTWAPQAWSVAAGRLRRQFGITSSAT